MSVIDISVRAPRKGGSYVTRKGLLAEVANRRYVKEYRVFTNDIGDGPEVVLVNPAVPKLGQSYALFNDLDILATCVKVDCDPTDNPYMWIVTAEYSTERLVDLTFEHPLNAPAEVSWTFTPHSRPFERDMLGVPVVSSANVKFDPPYEVDYPRLVLHIQRNEATFDPALARLYQNATNSDFFNGTNPYCARIDVFTGQRMVDVGVVYYRVTYEIQFREESFVLPLLDRGFHDIDLNPFRNMQTGEILSAASNLNGRGKHVRTGVANLIQAMDDSTSQCIHSLTPQTTNRFPPLADGGNPAPPHGFFEIKIDGEIMRVVATVGAGSTAWVVQRGWAGTNPATHANGAKIELQPYYLNFLPHKTLPFSVLGLPVV